MMNLHQRNILPAFLLILSVLFMSSCVERRYYREHHDHSPKWHHRHDPRPRVEVNIRN